MSIDITSDEVTTLLKKIDEFKRNKIVDAESYESFNYIDPNNNIDKITTHHNNIIYGRRGSGKTSLVFAAIQNINKKDTILYEKYDFQNFINQRYELVILKVLKDLFQKIKENSTYFKLNIKNFN